MYKNKIRNLELLLIEQNKKIDSLINDPNKNNIEFVQLVEQRSTTIKELSYLRKLQWDEDHERVNFDDDR